jgi:SM-20-related protein
VLLEPMECILNGLDQHGWVSVPGCMNHDDSIRLAQECLASCENGDFVSAGVGRGQGLEVRESIRQDRVKWIQPGEESVEQKIYLAKVDGMRLAINERFFFGLFDFECHFAMYPAGGFYKAHLDRHAGSGARIVTVILYLNQHWQPGDGGELKLWTTAGSREGGYALIEPRLGTMVFFMAGDFWHEVMPTAKPRMSITGWFRRCET